MSREFFGRLFEIFVILFVVSIVVALLQELFS